MGSLVGLFRERLRSLLESEPTIDSGSLERKWGEEGARDTQTRTNERLRTIAFSPPLAIVELPIMMVTPSQHPQRGLLGVYLENGKALGVVRAEIVGSCLQSRYSCGDPPAIFRIGTFLPYVGRRSRYELIHSLVSH